MTKKDFKLGGSSGSALLQEQTSSIIAESEFNLKFIRPENLIPNKLNSDFSQTDIEELSRSIEDIGLQHNLVVLKQDDGNYRIISGERRYRAICSLLSRIPSYPAFKRGLPCKVISGISEVDEEIRLLRSNTDTRELSPAERRKAVLRLIDLYNAKKEGGEIKSTYAELAADLQMSVRQIQKYAATGNLIPALENLLNDGKISLKDGERFSVLDEDGQQAIAELFEKHGSVSSEELAEIKRLKEEKELIKNELSNKIAELVKEKESLQLKIVEQQKQSKKLSDSLEIPGADIEGIVLKKIQAENTAKELSKENALLQEKYDQLKKELAKPIVIDRKRLEEVKVITRLEAALVRMESDFAVLSGKQDILYADTELLIRFHTLRNKINEMKETDWLNDSIEK